VRLWVYKVITVPNYNVFSKVLFFTDLILTLVPFVMLYIQMFNDSINTEHFSVLWCIASFFAIQYLLGLVTCKNKMTFIFNSLHLFELISFLPWIIYNTAHFNQVTVLDSENHPYSSGDSGAIGFLLVRILRTVSKSEIFSSRAQWLQEDVDICMETMHLAVTSYKPLSLWMCFLILFFSTLIYAFERGEHDGRIWVRFDDEAEESPFANFFNCIWYTIVTGTTLGYGDFYPKSYEGKVVGTFIVIIGLVNLTMLINTIGECFQEIFRNFLEKQSMEIERQRSEFIKQQVHDAGVKVEELRRKRVSRSKVDIHSTVDNNLQTKISSSI